MSLRQASRTKPPAASVGFPVVDRLPPASRWNPAHQLPPHPSPIRSPLRRRIVTTHRKPDLLAMMSDTLPKLPPVKASHNSAKAVARSAAKNASVARASASNHKEGKGHTAIKINPTATAGKTAARKDPATRTTTTSAARSS